LAPAAISHSQANKEEVEKEDTDAAPREEESDQKTVAKQLRRLLETPDFVKCGEVYVVMVLLDGEAKYRREDSDGFPQITTLKKAEPNFYVCAMSRNAERIPALLEEATKVRRREEGTSAPIPTSRRDYALVTGKLRTRGPVAGNDGLLWRFVDLETITDADQQEGVRQMELWSFPKDAGAWRAGQQITLDQTVYHFHNDLAAEAALDRYDMELDC